MMIPNINRRRFITITALAGGLSLFHHKMAFCYEKEGFFHWQGAALGAKAQIMLYSDKPSFAHDIFEKCQNEVRRLEKIFSLYVENSAINQFNKQGYLDNPPYELLDVMSRSLSCYKATDGAFDVTIQPLWSLYAGHFSQANADPKGPTEQQILSVLELVGSDKIVLDEQKIYFKKSDMGISLNGIAQGYITDKIVKILQDNGFENSLVYMGETYAMGQHADGLPWTAGIASPLKDENILKKIPLNHQALATSGGYGSPFSGQSKLHHLLDPKSGYSANHYGAVSVIAKDTTTADMLSTAIYVMPFEKLSKLWARYPMLEKVILVDQGGKVTEVTA
ncbi:MAG: FAD:protein FMN transferase [Emcibacter sp.]|nr:FAD:protein FMN transferase [Emcibacter sp.]